MIPHFYGMDGQPISEAEWIETLADPTARRVAMTRLDRDGNVVHDVGLRGDADWSDVDAVHVDISTVLLGLDHGFGESDAPIIFETMAFGDIELDQYGYRYTTLAEAQAGHAEMVSFIRTMLDVKRIDVGGEPPDESEPS